LGQGRRLEQGQNPLGLRIEGNDSHGPRQTQTGLPSPFQRNRGRLTLPDQEVRGQWYSRGIGAVKKEATVAVVGTGAVHKEATITVVRARVVEKEAAVTVVRGGAIEQQAAVTVVEAGRRTDHQISRLAASAGTVTFAAPGTARRRFRVDNARQ
jgi:hypothetical protein